MSELFNTVEFDNGEVIRVFRCEDDMWMLIRVSDSKLIYQSIWVTIQDVIDFANS